MKSEPAGEAKEAAKDEAKEEAKDETASSSKAETITAPAINSTATAATRSAPSTSNTATVPTRALSAATKSATATSSTVATTKSEPPPAKIEPAATLSASEDESDDQESSSDSSSDDKPAEKLVVKEVFIAVMGQTGAGKSSFINWVTGKNLAVGHGLDSCTQNVQTASTSIDGRAVTLIDTPGFDDSSRFEGEIINLIAAYLKLTYDREDLLSGVIYLHRITDNKVGMASRRTMTLLQKMCGVDNYQNIVLVTTRWDELKNESVGEDRERELESKDNFWAQMIAKKAKKFRHNHTKETAVEIVKHLIPKRPAPLEMQTELSSEQGNVAGTHAGKYISDYLLGEKKNLENGDSIAFLDKEAVLDRQKIAERIDQDIGYMQVPVKDLLLQAQEAGTKSEDGGATVAGEVTEDNGLANTSDASSPRRSFLQKLLDMVKWMDTRVKPT